MLSLVIQSDSAGDQLDLGALLDGDEGVQAIAGLTGAGLPPVSVQWSEGAGDGATYRGKRVLPRDMDVPLFVSSPTRAGLRSVVKRLSRILADEATLTLTDSVSGEWTLKVVRVGGGDFIYGPDTDGERDLAFIVTLRAGQPYWTSTTPNGITKTGDAQLANTLYEMYNAGTAASPLVWEIRGPGKNLSINYVDGSLQWNGTLVNGESLFIDTEKGTVVDGNGANRYAELGPTPRFASIRSQTTHGWTVSWPTLPSSVVRTNLCVNPAAKNNTTSWTALSGTLTRSSGFRVAPTNKVVTLTHANVTVTPGSAYSFAGLFTTLGNMLWVKTRLAWYTSGNVLLSITEKQHYPLVAEGGTSLRVAVTGTAPDGASYCVPSFYVQYNSTTGNSAFVVTQILIEQSATVQSFFDGDTTDTVTNVYAWTGTSGNSTSTLTVVPDRSVAMVKATFYERDWMVI